MGCCSAAPLADGGRDLKAGGGGPGVDAEEIHPSKDSAAKPPQVKPDKGGHGGSAFSSGPRAVAPPVGGSTFGPPRAAPPSAGFDDAAHLQPGTSVIICGLTEAAHINGEKGVCERWDPSRGRWHVRTHGGEVHAVRPDNLRMEQLSPRMPGQAAPAQAARGEVGAPRSSDGASTDVDPPLLGAQGSSGPAGSARAKAASRLLERSSSTEVPGSRTKLASLDVSFLDELSGSSPTKVPFQFTFPEDRGGQRTTPFHADKPVADADTELLSTVEDQRVVLADLDGDMQLPSLGGRRAR